VAFAQRAQGPAHGAELVPNLLARGLTQSAQPPVDQGIVQRPGHRALGEPLERERGAAHLPVAHVTGEENQPLALGEELPDARGPLAPIHQGVYVPGGELPEPRHLGEHGPQVPVHGPGDAPGLGLAHVQGRADLRDAPVAMAAVDMEEERPQPAAQGHRRGKGNQRQEPSQGARGQVLEPGDRDGTFSSHGSIR